MILRQFTHDDADGAACAVVAAYIFPDAERKVTYCQYGSGHNSIDTNVMKFLNAVEAGKDKATLLLITDICPSPSVCERIEAMKGNFDRVLVQDHHGTTAWAAKYDWMEHEAKNERSGAKMLFDTCGTFNQPADDFVNAIDAYDRWQLKSEHRARGEDLNVLYKFLGSKLFAKEFEASFEADKTGWLKHLIPVLKDRIEGQIEGIIQDQMENAVHVDKEKRRYAFLTIGSAHASEIGHAVLDRYPNVDYVVMAVPGIDTISMRSRKDGVDVGAIAKANGGGGHAGAAGFPYNLREITWNSAAGVFE